MLNFRRLASILVAGLISGSPALATADTRTGTYYNASEPGRGFTVEINDAGRFFFAAFAYDTSGEPVFWTASGTMAGNVASAPLIADLQRAGARRSVPHAGRRRWSARCRSTSRR